MVRLPPKGGSTGETLCSTGPTSFPPDSSTELHPPSPRNNGGGSPRRCWHGAAASCSRSSWEMWHRLHEIWSTLYTEDSGLQGPGNMAQTPRNLEYSVQWGLWSLRPWIMLHRFHAISSTLSSQNSVLWSISIKAWVFYLWQCKFL